MHLFLCGKKYTLVAILVAIVLSGFVWFLIPASNAHADEPFVINFPDGSSVRMLNIQTANEYRSFSSALEVINAVFNFLLVWHRADATPITTRVDNNGNIVSVDCANGTEVVANYPSAPTPTSALQGQAPVPTLACPTCAFGCANGVCLPPPMQITLAVSPQLTRKGTRALITWSSEFASSCTMSGNGNSWPGLSGSERSNPIENTVVYTLSCTGPDLARAVRTAVIHLTPEYHQN